MRWSAAPSAPPGPCVDGSADPLADQLGGAADPLLTAPPVDGSADPLDGWAPTPPGSADRRLSGGAGRPLCSRGRLYRLCLPGG